MPVELVYYQEDADQVPMFAWLDELPLKALQNFFHKQTAVVVSHGFTKERAVPPREIVLAIRRKRKFEANPKHHTFAPKG